MAEKHGMPAEDALEPGEAILALATCQPPGAIENQTFRAVRVVVTDMRFLVLETNALTGRSKGAVEFELPLRDVTSVEMRKRRSIATVGLPILVVRLSLADGRSMAFESSGILIKRHRKLAEVLMTAAQSVEGSQYRSRPESAGEQ
jgi:hypothetical protein